MKRIFLVLLALFMLLAASCGKMVPPSPTPPSVDPPPSISLLSCETSWVGWTGGERLQAFADNASEIGTDRSHMPARVVTSAEALLAVREAFADVFQFAVKWDEFSSFDAKMGRYDDAFFEEYVLILIYVEANSGSYRFGVEGVYLDGDVVRATVKQLNAPEAVTDDMAGWMLAVPLAREGLPEKVGADAIKIGNKS